MIYSTWWEGGLDIDGALLRRLAELPHVEAVKWSAPTHDRFTEGIAAIADRLVVIDNQGLHVWGHILGANGFVTHISNFWPEYPLAIWRALEAHDYEAVPAILGRFKWSWSDWAGRVASISGGEGAFIKAAMEARRVHRRAASSACRPADAGAHGRARRAVRSGRRPAGGGDRNRRARPATRKLTQLSGTAATRPDGATFAAFRLPGYAALWISGAATAFARSITLVAIGWTALLVSDSVFAVGATFAARFVPSLILGIPLGALVDRFDRRTTLVVANLIGGAPLILAAAVAGGGSAGPPRPARVEPGPRDHRHGPGHGGHGVCVRPCRR